MAGEVSFFELGVEDVQQARTFYGQLFGWEFAGGPSGNGFHIATPTINGGMHGGDAGAVPYLFFAVDDMDEAVRRVRELGGTVEASEHEGDDDTGSGRFKFCRDDQGSRFGLHQPPRAA